MLHCKHSYSSGLNLYGLVSTGVNIFRHFIQRWRSMFSRYTKYPWHPLYCVPVAANVHTWDTRSRHRLFEMRRWLLFFSSCGLQPSSAATCLSLGLIIVLAMANFRVFFVFPPIAARCTTLCARIWRWHTRRMFNPANIYGPTSKRPSLLDWRLHMATLGLWESRCECLRLQMWVSCAKRCVKAVRWFSCPNDECPDCTSLAAMISC